MKKRILLGLVALALGASAVKAQEVTYVEDCSQGLLLNRNADNWFFTAEGGTNILFGKHNVDALVRNRLGGNAAIYFGKWVTPTFGFRFGAKYLMTKGATDENGVYRKENAPKISGKNTYPEKLQGVGPEFDVLINLTNWWCGYKPNRLYNAVLHGGGGVMWTFARRWNDPAHMRWVAAHSTPLFVNVGLQNNFRVAKRVDIFVDVQYELFRLEGYKHFSQDLSLSAGLNVYFGKKDWNCPTVAVCPTWKYTDAEGDALVARLAQAENKIADLQRQLDECLNRPVQKIKCEGLCTIYYPINQYGLSKREKTILKSMAEVMMENPSQKYILTGWADNYTGNDEINTRLRNQRVNGVKDYLVRCGVSESQLDARIDASNLTDFGIKGAPLDRAVTIKLAD